MLVPVRCFIPRRVFPVHLSQTRRSDNPCFRSLLPTSMVQTRRATQLASELEDQPEPMPMPAVAKSPTKAEHLRRPFKRIKKEHQVDARASSPAVIEPREVEQNDVGASSAKPPRKARRGKEHVIPKPSDFAPRVSSAWKVGAHVSAAGGVENAIVNAARVGANAFALFVKSQRKWTSPSLMDDNVVSFKARMNEFGYDPKYVLPHGSYLINLANPDKAKREKSYECFLDDLQRCERLGLVFYNFHPGSTVGNATKEESISLIAQCLNKAHKETSYVITVIENMSGAKNIIGSQFAELRDIIEQVEDKSRVGVCLDTCHMYAAGYDISTKAGWDTTMAMFDEQVGLSYLRGMHLNDSKTPLGSKKDRHENIGLGTLKLSAFLTILSDPRVQNIPLILETPSFEAMEVWEREIKTLNTLSEVGAGSDATGEEGDAGRNEMLQEMAGDIRNVVRKYNDHKKKVGKKNVSGGSMSKSKAKSRKRKTTGDEEENATSSAQSCTEDSD